jgi:hypothetical protein
MQATWMLITYYVRSVKARSEKGNGRLASGKKKLWLHFAARSARRPLRGILVLTCAASKQLSGRKTRTSSWPRCPAPSDARADTHKQLAPRRRPCKFPEPSPTWSWARGDQCGPLNLFPFRGVMDAGETKPEESSSFNLSKPPCPLLRHSRGGKQKAFEIRG